MEESEFNYINVIPLVDIMLVLLTIVLTTSTLVATGTIPLSLPQASSERAAMPQVRIIEIDKGGTVFLNSLPVCIARLKDELAPNSRETPILIRADRQLVLQQFVDVLDIVKQLGFAKVSLQTEAM